MKIYNEVVYQIIDDKLVKVSEDSFEYSGEIAECKNAAKTVTKAISTVADPITEGVVSGERALRKGPQGGMVKGMTDTAKQWSQKGSHHAFGTDYDGDDSNDDVDYSSPTYEAGEDEALAELEAQRKQQGNLRGRLASNTTQGQTASLLTQPVA